MCIDSFYRHIHKIVLPNIEKELLCHEDQEKLQTNLIGYLKFFPHFPNIQFITDLSCENYEQKVCVAKLIFLPFKDEVDDSSFTFLYDNEKICFDDNKRRLIRKILESLNDSHALVLENNNDNKYYIKGIVNINDVNSLFDNYYFISILGYLKWSAKCRNFNLFNYDKGKFTEFIDRISELNKMIEKVNHPNFLELKINDFKEIIKLIVLQNHGTSFVIFNLSEDAQYETDRLCKAGRGFKIKNILPYNKLSECIPQFTKVDGGLILDKELNCYAYGCIYDGCIDKSFVGSLDRGSRYNSTKLYVHSLNNKNPSTCFGVVFSDDGGVEGVI